MKTTHRKEQRKTTRWKDGIVEVFGSRWVQAVQDRLLWNYMGEGLCSVVDAAFFGGGDDDGSQ